MAADLKVIEGGYLRDILRQPEALKDTVENLELSSELKRLGSLLNRGTFQCVVLTGMGASFHALHPLNLRLIDHGFRPIMVETSELIHYQPQLIDRSTLIVVVSQSGQSAESVRLVEINRRRANIIAVTNTPESPLAKKANATLITRAGNEFSVSCKTYVTALMALKYLGDVLCQRDAKASIRELKPVSAAVSTYLANWADHVALLASRLAGVRNLFFVGRGTSLAAVGSGALIVKESDHVHAEGMSSAAFRHGPLEVLSQETFVIVFSGDRKTHDLNHRLLTDIRQAGGRAELIGETSQSPCFRLSDHSSSVRAILEILPVQMLTLALAAMAGREAGKFDRATKITTTE